MLAATALSSVCAMDSGTARASAFSARAIIARPGRTADPAA